ncbi:MAG: hypothetical protein H6739_07780 [Alphaproteobacteria bacterium]|nr:hypothetical protein [Alphaproteobacteria bacterium]
MTTLNDSCDPSRFHEFCHLIRASLPRMRAQEVVLCCQALGVPHTDPGWLDAWTSAVALVLHLPPPSAVLFMEALVQLRQLVDERGAEDVWERLRIIASEAAEETPQEHGPTAVIPCMSWAFQGMDFELLTLARMSWASAGAELFRRAVVLWTAAVADGENAGSFGEREAKAPLLDTLSEESEATWIALQGLAQEASGLHRELMLLRASQIADPKPTPLRGVGPDILTTWMSPTTELVAMIIGLRHPTSAPLLSRVIALRADVAEAPDMTHLDGLQVLVEDLKVAIRETTYSDVPPWMDALGGLLLVAVAMPLSEELMGLLDRMADLWVRGWSLLSQPEISVQDPIH